MTDGQKYFCVPIAFTLSITKFKAVYKFKTRSGSMNGEHNNFLVVFGISVKELVIIHGSHFYIMFLKKKHYLVQTAIRRHGLHFGRFSII